MGKDRKRILVTGAAGFIGSALCEKMAVCGWEVLGIDNMNCYYDSRLKEARLKRMGFEEDSSLASEKPIVSNKYSSLSFVKADITERETMVKIFSEWQPDTVMNLAAQAGVRYSIENPYTYITNNIDGFIVLLECARNYPVRKFVYASSSSVYGGNTKVPFSESDTVDNPVSLYAATKKSNEMMARAYRNLYGVPAVGLRFFTVYGPWGRPDMAPMLFAKAITEGDSINVFNNGYLSRDFTYIDDIVEAVSRVIESDDEIDSENDIYNIGHGSPVNLMDFIGLLELSLGREALKNYLPMQKGDVLTTFADTSRLEKRYGYHPSTTLEDGIGKFAEWYNSKDNPLK